MQLSGKQRLGLVPDSAPRFGPGIDVLSTGLMPRLSLNALLTSMFVRKLVGFLHPKLASP